MKQATDLRQQLASIDRKSYPAYKSVAGVYDFKDFILSIDHVQGDPFASPSKVSVSVPHRLAGFPAELYDKAHKRTALEDYLLRKFADAIAPFSFKARGSGKSGLIATSRPGQEILSRSASECSSQGVTIRLEVGFPAMGRTIAANELIKLLFDFLPGCVRKVLYYKNHNPQQVEAVICLAEDQKFIREELKRRDLVAFVANGAILPRETGVSSKPLKGAVRFQSPEPLQVTMDLPHHGSIAGMGIARGITLIVGGGYHGKSTLLKALETGVYNHIAGDGREYVITDDTAVKLRAEDGRSIRNVDISLFINHLPNGKDTRRFSTSDASGSTSQAAAVVEGMEAGAQAFLIDEDTSATNFMLRDDLMQRVISQDKEPITPFIQRARDLYEKAGISTILVAGSSGAYFYIADTIIQMDCYRPYDITASVRDICRQRISGGLDNPEKGPGEFFAPSPDRKLESEGHSKKAAGGFNSRRGGKADDRIKVKVYGRDSFQIGKETVEMRFVEQLADSEQTAALAQMLRSCLQRGLLERFTVRESVGRLLAEMDHDGLAAFSDTSYQAMGLCRPRTQEIFACISRYRGDTSV